MQIILLEWFAVSMVVFSAYLNAIGYTPYNLISAVLAALLWIIVGIVWDKLSLIVINIILIGINLYGITLIYGALSSR